MKTKCQRLLNPETLEDYGLSITETEAMAEGTREGTYLSLILRACREQKEDQDEMINMARAMGQAGREAVVAIAVKILKEEAT